MLQMILSSIQDPDEREFFLHIFHQYHLLMFHEASIYISDPYEKEDVVQNALVKAIENSSKIYRMERCKIASYLVIITRNEAINYLRHKKVISKHSAGSIEDYQSELPDRPSIEDLIGVLERKQLLEYAWPKLTTTEQILLAGRYIIGYSDHELSRILGCKEGSVRMMLTRARRHAAKVLNEEGVVYE